MFTRNPGLRFPLPLCLLSLPSRSHSNGCSACSSSRTLQLKWPWPAWLRPLAGLQQMQGLLYPTDRALSQPAWASSPKHSSCPQHPLCVRGFVALAEFLPSEILVQGKGETQTIKPRVWIQSPGLCDGGGGGGVSLEQLGRSDVGVSQQTLKIT